MQHDTCASAEIPKSYEKVVTESVEQREEAKLRSTEQPEQEHGLENDLGLWP